jgi:predicted TIM-barrel fold metal-dependent hydrolase
VQLAKYRPKSQLINKPTFVNKPRFPVIDAHNHLGEPFGGGWDKKPISELIDLLDKARVILYVDLDGGWGEDILNVHLDHFKAKYPDRFQVFAGVDWREWQSKGDEFPGWAAARLRIQKERGAQGLKIWKDFGLRVRDQNDVLVKVDDERLIPIWETAAELDLPVMIHVADPVAFFDPVDETNERFEELTAHPEWVFSRPPFPPFLEIMESFANLVIRHTDTIFIGAHVGCYAENLEWVGKLLNRCPNCYVDISARIAELGRQPYSARRFFIQHADRILFGLDAGPDLETYRTYYRFLETDDEYFKYNPDPEGIPDSGRWMIYGLYLPDSILQKIYYQNAERIFNLQTLD